MSITRQNLSVIIVSYKSDHVIENCINSIDNEIEIIVIENSNNDKLKNKIETKYKKNTNTLNLISQIKKLKKYFHNTNLQEFLI